MHVSRACARRLTALKLYFIDVIEVGWTEYAIERTKHCQAKRHSLVTQRVSNGKQIGSVPEWQLGRCGRTQRDAAGCWQWQVFTQTPVTVLEVLILFLDDITIDD